MILALILAALSPSLLALLVAVRLRRVRPVVEPRPGPADDPRG